MEHGFIPNIQSNWFPMDVDVNGKEIFRNARVSQEPNA
jgi:hypothetical protein